MRITQSKLKDFFNVHSYDIRIHKNARWIDQKCTPDVVNIVADCVLEYSYDFGKGPDSIFTVKDIWNSDFANENITSIFSKPDTQGELSRNEYDKFFAQPIELLAYAGVLGKEKRGNRNYYYIQNESMLEYIALKPINSAKFLVFYIEEVLRQSGLISSFDLFFLEQNKKYFEQLKQHFADFTIYHTPINGKLEVNRIYAKVLNPLAWDRRKKGTNRGRLSKDTIVYSDLMYNRDNFRDLYLSKPKGLTRTEWLSKQSINPNDGYSVYLSNKAKRKVREYNNLFNNGYSEMQDEYALNKKGEATQIHHIFPESEYPEIAMFTENLIALNPNQHNIKAHPQNKTSIIDEDYQEKLIYAKIDNIQNSIINNLSNNIYDSDDLIQTLNTGLDLELENIDITNDNDVLYVKDEVANYFIDSHKKRIGNNL